MRPQLQIVRSISRLVCTGCGAETNAACNCGKAYEILREQIAEKQERERERVRAAMQKSREKTKEKQRSVTVTDDPPDDEAADTDHEEGLRVLAVRGFLHRAVDATRLADLGRLAPADVTEEMIEKAECAAAAWNTAARKLRGLKCQSI